MVIWVKPLDLVASMGQRLGNDYLVIQQAN